jgi:hypothetical protein
LTFEIMMVYDEHRFMLGREFIARDNAHKKEEVI